MMGVSGGLGDSSHGLGKCGTGSEVVDAAEAMDLKSALVVDSGKTSLDLTSQ